MITMYKYVIKQKNGKTYYSTEITPLKALISFLDKHNYQVKGIRKVSNNTDYDFYVKRKNGLENYYKVNVIKKVEKEGVSMSIQFEGKSYEKRRYTYDELKKLFDGKVVYVTDATMKGLYPIDGVLVGVCTTEQKDDMAYKYLVDGIAVEKLDFSKAPLVLSYQGVM